MHVYCIVCILYFFTCIAPSAPQNVAAVNVTSSSITWIWDQPTNHGNKVTHYHGQLQVFYRDVGNVNVTTGTYYQWSRLSANTQYRFRARAVTGSGIYGSWSNWKTQKTLPAGMPGTTVHAILIAWLHFKLMKFTTLSELLH